MELAKEKGTYAVFPGSDWQTGEYFRARDYNSPQWLELAAQVAVNGVRNAYMVAVAPNMSTAQI
ncbi:ribonucleoside-diphosphate reductase subunit alpha, partial [Xylella fastidiosa]|nr:ribonucleoside-diphosphate reductase subunit alpha [Xylella fastidiosa]